MINWLLSNAHFLLVKKLPGQPPSGAMVPSTAPGAPPKFIAQPPEPGEFKLQRPAILTGGGVRGPPGAARGAVLMGPAGAAAKGSVLSLLPKLSRSAQPTSTASTATTPSRRAARTAPCRVLAACKVIVTSSSG